MKNLWGVGGNREWCKCEFKSPCIEKLDFPIPSLNARKSGQNDCGSP